MKLGKLTGVELKLLQRSWESSAVKLGKLCREVGEVLQRSWGSSAEKLGKLIGVGFLAF